MMKLRERLSAAPIGQLLGIGLEVEPYLEPCRSKSDTPEIYIAVPPGGVRS